MDENPASDSRPARTGSFNPDTLVPHFIAEPLASKLALEEAQRATNADAPETIYEIIIDLNTKFPRGRAAARACVFDMLRRMQEHGESALTFRASTADTLPYVFASMTARNIRYLAQEMRSDSSGTAIFRIWEDHDVEGLITQSISTVKADAAHISFSAVGRGIVWAVLDTGIERDHPHFKKFANLDVAAPLEHRDYTLEGDDSLAEHDPNGHGTHVAGIIAGADASPPGDPTAPGRITVLLQQRDESNAISYTLETPSAIAGMAPQCKLLSLRVLDSKNRGRVSFVIEALEYVQLLNEYGRSIVVHGVNMSLGYAFDPEWFACGQSPLCVEVDRLVRSGVSVIVAAGNSGYGYANTEFSGVWAQGMGMSINDPANAELAISVGSTHREMPHTYGVSYFSSKGPTGDGRRKPDVLAPGERIVSCAAGLAKTDLQKRSKSVAFDYLEDSGTSMAAPHVSGIVAAFLSIRREFIGKPLDVKQIILATATDLRRDPNHQGAGLVDLMRAIQSV